MSDRPKIPKNLATWDRALRAAAGAALLGVWALRGFSGLLFPVLGVALLANAAMGSCGLYSMLGISTCPVKLRAPDETPPAPPR